MNFCYKKTKPSLIYLATLFFFGLVFFVLFLWGSKNNVATFSNQNKLLFSLLYSLLPAVVFFPLQFFCFKQKFSSFGIVWNFNIWWLFAWLLPLSILALTILLLYYDFLFAVQPDFALNYYMESLQKNMHQQDFLRFQEKFQEQGVRPILTATLGLAFLWGSTFQTFVAFAEEIGWRGFLQRQWANMGFFKSSLLIGFVQSLWYFPLVVLGLYFSFSVWGFVMIFFSMTAFSLLLSYIRYRTASLFPVAIARGFFVALFGVPMMLFRGGSDFAKHLLGVYGFISIVLILIFLWTMAKFLKFFSLPSLDVLEEAHKKIIEETS